jgi:hypothetical protein
MVSHSDVAGISQGSLETTYLQGSPSIVSPNRVASRRAEERGQIWVRITLILVVSGLLSSVALRSKVRALRGQIPLPQALSGER